MFTVVRDLNRSDLFNQVDDLNVRRVCATEDSLLKDLGQVRLNPNYNRHVDLRSSTLVSRKSRRW